MKTKNLFITVLFFAFGSIAWAGPLVSAGGTQTLVASCLSAQYEVALIKQSGIVYASVKERADDTVIATSVVNVIPAFHSSPFASSAVSQDKQFALGFYRNSNKALLMKAERSDGQPPIVNLQLTCESF